MAVLPPNFFVDALDMILARSILPESTLITS